MNKNATVVAEVCPKNYLFCIPTNVLPQLFDIFTQIYPPYLRHFSTLLQEDFARAFPNLFRLLWKSTLPCYPSTASELSNSTHLLRQCRWEGRQRQGQIQRQSQRQRQRQRQIKDKDAVQVGGEAGQLLRDLHPRHHRHWSLLCFQSAKRLEGIRVQTPS